MARINSGFVQSRNAQYILTFFAGMAAFWASSWVAGLLSSDNLLPNANVLNLVTLIVTLSLYLAFMPLWSAIMRYLGVKVDVGTTALAALVAGLFGFVFLATIRQIYTDSNFTASDAVIVRLAVSGIFGIFFSVGWWCGDSYGSLARKLRR